MRIAFCAEKDGGQGRVHDMEKKGETQKTDREKVQKLKNTEQKQTNIPAEN